MKLEIKEPCHEDWNNMKIGMHSRHCDVCEKSVQDFTKKNRAEIITFLLSNQNDSTCGRMTRDQFDFRHEDIPILIETLKVQKTSNPFLILALVCLSLSACAQDQPIKNIKTPPVIKQDIMGKVALPPVSDSVKTVQNDSIIQKTPDCNIEYQGEVGLVGDISIEEVPVLGGIGFIDENHVPIKDEEARQFAEVMPECPGGMDAMQSFIKANLQYPDYEKKNNISGNVYVRFVVEKDGSLTRFEILRSVQESVNFDDEVIRVLGLMPNWTPGRNKGEKIPVYMTLPFQFKIY